VRSSSGSRLRCEWARAESRGTRIYGETSRVSRELFDNRLVRDPEVRLAEAGGEDIARSEIAQIMGKTAFEGRALSVRPRLAVTPPTWVGGDKSSEQVDIASDGSTTDGTRRTAHDGRHTAHGTRHTAHGTRHTAHDRRHTTDGSATDRSTTDRSTTHASDSAQAQPAQAQPAQAQPAQTHPRKHNPRQHNPRQHNAQRHKGTTHHHSNQLEHQRRNP
jgi:hypothetical protein